MDDLKSKFLGLIQKQGNTKIPIVGSQLEDAVDTEPVPKKNESQPVKEPERPSDQEILESIDDDYYTVDESFDACKYELKKIIGHMNVDRIEKDLMKLRQQHLVISKQVLQMILEKQTACRKEFERVMEVQKCIDEVLSTVRSSRDNLGISTRHFTTASLGILANYRKRTLVQMLLRSLNTLKTLQRTESRLEELLSEGDFPGAIALLRECLGVAAQYRHFTCVTDLTAKLNDTLVMAEEHLDVALAKICYEFDEEVYRKLQSAYFLLGKTQIAMDQLHMHFTSAVHNSAFNVVHSFANLDSQSGSKKQYSQLCKCLSEEKLIACLLGLCKALWAIVLSYNKVVVWHQNNTQNISGDCFESNYNDSYVRQKLENGLTRLWNDVQTRVSSLVLSANLSNYKFDDFLQVLGILHRLSQIGEELCGSDSEEVASSVRTQSSNYFKIYHAARLDDLKVFLENEAWTPCPVRSDFTLLHLQEFRGLRCSVEQCAGVMSRHDSSLDGSSVGTGFFTRFPNPHLSTPFDTNFHIDTRDEEILASIPDEPSGYYSEESDDESDMRHNQNKDHRAYSKRIANYPLLTNTTLTVLRHCGKYLQMSRLLKSIATEVVTALCQLFEYYLYTVHSFFVTSLSGCPQVSSIKLHAILKRIKESLIYTTNATGDDCSQRVLEAQVSPVVDLSRSENLYGLTERIVAVESLVFLSQQYNFLRPYLEQLLQSQGSTVHHLNLFYTQTVSVSIEVRKPVCASVSWRAVDAKNAVAMMSKVNWEVKEVISQHSDYVDVILRELQVFSMRLEDIKMQIAIPDQVSSILWENIAHHLAYIFVEGFSSSKKCSHGGRTLMQLDYTQLISKLEKLSSLRPVPHREFVEAYVKAFYQSEEELETWIHEHKEFTSKQLLALVSCVCQSNKKTKQRLTAIIEDSERSGVR